ncbi:hypothetical protein BGZ58_003488 [Dissophora ornata]|nr:hypothetical protein BGZ58_003488 [Dissophora ornata]
MERLKGEKLQEWLAQHLTSPWHGHQTIAAELGNDTIDNIRERWTQLGPPARLGVLFSLISVKKAQQQHLKENSQKLIDTACTDPDEWVRLVSQMLKDYPTEGTLRFNVEQFADQAQLGSLMSELTSHKRAERLRQIAEQASPIVAMAAGNLSSVGVGAAPTGATPPNTITAGSGVGNGSASAPQVLGPPGPPGPPRPTKSSSGLFVRKPAGSFLRNNAPRPMPLPRNPSAGQLPLRSPRLEGPTTPRLNQKSSRIQILDIQQGTEIMQSMNDAKLRKEQAEQREKELKKEQRAQEMELKRQQEAEKKAQLQKEKEEKKKEREEAKKVKDRQRQERDEQTLKERERQKQDKGQDQELDRSQARETRTLPDDDDDEEDADEGSLSSLPVRKKLRRSNSRRSSRDDYDDDDYDNDQPDQSREPMSPVTPTLNSRYSSHGVHDDGLATSIEYTPVIRPNGNETSYQIIMNQEQIQDQTGRTMYELILIEMNFETGEWRKIKRRRVKPHVPISSSSTEVL